MADITVRKVRFDFEPEEPLVFSDDDEEFLRQLLMLGISLTMPYLEPYLIRTMRTAGPQISDPTLAEDTRRFSQQEGHHYRNHAKFNEQIRHHFGAATAAELRTIESALEADYRRFTREKKLRFNLAYAEGFEAMTCALALAAAEHGLYDNPALFPGGEIWAWHMAEEIEHRTVAFGVFEHLVGSYAYRIVVGTWAQWHYLRYVKRFADCAARAVGRVPRERFGPVHKTFLRRYARTWSPRYDPALLDVPPAVEGLLARFTDMAGAAH